MRRIKFYCKELHYCDMFQFNGSKTCGNIDEHTLKDNNMLSTLILHQIVTPGQYISEFW